MNKKELRSYTSEQLIYELISLAEGTGALELQLNHMPVLSKEYSATMKDQHKVRDELLRRLEGADKNEIRATNHTI